MAEPAPAAIDRSGKIRQEPFRNEFAQPPRGPPFRARKKQREQRNQEQCPKPAWRAKSHHGNFFQMVCASRSCISSNPSPAPMQTGKRSRYC